MESARSGGGTTPQGERRVGGQSGVSKVESVQRGGAQQGEMCGRGKRRET